ncbi:UNVERIFIED_CONTAM: hypothetical protein GTU68_058609, partial [Idotea baltica]|nr:hypothetical protein [Idotea baltica]
IEALIGLCLKEAKKAAGIGEVPVGAVITQSGKVIAQAHNEVETSNSAIKHAEILAIERASKKLGRWRLNDCELYVSLEPCPMCAGAILASRISRVIFAASDPRQGACGSVFNILKHAGLPTRCEIIHGPNLVKGATESEEVLKNFFTTLRKKKT